MMLANSLFTIQNLITESPTIVFQSLKSASKLRIYWILHSSLSVWQNVSSQSIQVLVGGWNCWALAEVIHPGENRERVGEGDVGAQEGVGECQVRTNEPEQTNDLIILLSLLTIRCGEVWTAANSVCSVITHQHNITHTCSLVETEADTVCKQRTASPDSVWKVLDFIVLTFKGRRAGSKPFCGFWQISVQRENRDIVSHTQKCTFLLYCPQEK